jgi:thioredoxin reductase (NADPH)
VATTRKVVIIGSGPAGYTAAIYAARANLSPVMFTGIQPGGQLMLTTLVENYPGFVEGIDGPPLMETFQKQAERFGTEMIADDVTEVDFRKRPFTVTGGDVTIEAHTVILATGASAKLLGLPNESKLMGRGVSTCATCDGFFFRGKPLAVVGGGDSAVEEALFLTKFATEVTVIHRRDELRASKIMADRAHDHPKIAFRWNAVVDEVVGNGSVEGLRLRDTVTDERSELPVGGLFVAIGHDPNTALFQGQLDLDDGGYVVTAPDSTSASVDGVFAAGDVQDHVFRQAVTAAGSGCMAAMEAERWLSARAHAAR